MIEAEPTVREYTIKPLGPDTWEAFARLAGRHNGVWNGCWCTWFHASCAERGGQGRTAESNRALKERLVNDGHAHAALVFDGDIAVGWCEYGTPGELPNIFHRKEYEAGLDRLPDYRLTCFFVDRGYRRKGIAAVALAGALALIAQAGGGVVEGYPQDTHGKRTSGSFLYNGTRSLFERAGFSYERPKGKNHCVMRRTVLPGRPLCPRAFITDPSSPSYVICYPAGRTLCRAYVAGQPERFRRLLTEQVRVSDLLAAQGPGSPGPGLPPSPRHRPGTGQPRRALAGGPSAVPRKPGSEGRVARCTAGSGARPGGSYRPGKTARARCRG